MVLKSSWIVVAAVLLGQQSSVLAAPLLKNSETDPGSCAPRGKYDYKPYWEPEISSIPDPNGEDPRFPIEFPHLHGEDSFGDFPKKWDHGSLSDPSSRVPYHGSGHYPGARYPDTKPYSGKSESVAKDHTLKGVPDDDIDYPVDQNVGDSYGKKTTKPVDGTISDPTYTDGIPDPVNHRGGNWYDKNKKPNAHGNISDPTFVDEPINQTADPRDECSDEKDFEKLYNGTISDPTYAEDPNSSTTYPSVGDGSYGKNRGKNVKGTISDAEGIRGHTHLGKPCIVPASIQNDKYPYGDKSGYYAKGDDLICIPDEFQKENPHDDGKETHPYKFANGDKKDKSI